MEYYFDPDDKLERRKYAEFLKSMLENCDHYRREDSDGAYVIAIDSPWGTGKTRFAKMLRNSIEGREPKIINDKVDQTFIPEPNDTRKFNVIYYNSWETDYWNDAIEPLMDSILNSEAFTKFRKDKRNKETWDNLLKFAKGVLKASGYVLANKAFGETAVGVFKEGLSEIREKPIDPLKDFKNKSAFYKEFRNALELVITKTGRTLVVIIDELDRCRPTYAIQTLELVKHLFAAKGLVFVFALDVEQLSCAVRTIYGDMDAPGYLCRFFDYVGKMPDPNRITFIKLCLDQHAKFSSNGVDWVQKTINYINALSNSFSLSLRDLTTIIKSYLIMFDSFLYSYENFQFHSLYLFLITMKYKKASLYSDFLLNKRSEKNYLIETKKYTPEMVETDKTVLSEQLQMISNYAPLTSIIFTPRYAQVERTNRELRDNSFLIEKVEELRKSSGENILRFSTRRKGLTSKNSYLGEDVEMNKNMVLFDVLDYNDVRKWLKIRDLTLGQYYYQQLEMFNFALPADEPTTQP